MWSISALLLAAAGAGGAAHGPVTPTACPTSSGGVRMTGGDVYDGPIEDNAILVPDSAHTARGTETSSWNVRNTYRAGRQIFLSCDYAARPKVIVRVSRPVSVCRYADGRRAKTLACR